MVATVGSHPGGIGRIDQLAMSIQHERTNYCVVVAIERRVERSGRTFATDNELTGSRCDMNRNQNQLDGLKLQTELIATTAVADVQRTEIEEIDRLVCRSSEHSSFRLQIPIRLANGRTVAQGCRLLIA